MIRPHAIAAFVFLTCAVAAPARPQAAGVQREAAGDVPYRTLVEHYGHGDLDGSVAALARLPRARVRDEVNQLKSQHNAEAMKAASMLHTDLALVLATADRDAADLHLEIAESLIRLLPNSLARFKERWFAYAVTVYLLRGDLPQAQNAVNRGVTAYSSSAELTLMAGTILEIRARAIVKDLRDEWPENGRLQTLLRETTATYQRALKMDANLLPARLRLGWVYLANRSRAHAREQLEIVLAQTTDPELRYLASLLMGGVEEADSHPAEAFRQYETAHALFPQAQSAFLALIHAARMAGVTDVARDLSTQYANRLESPTEEDPWWYFAVGFSGSELVDWLRQAAQVS